MQIQTTETEYCKLRVHYEEDPDTVKTKRNEVLHKFKNAEVPGFRKGKASMDAIKSYLKKDIKEALANTLATEAVQNTVMEKNLKLFGNPQFSGYTLEDDRFTCDFSVFVHPTFELKQYKDFEIPKPKNPTSVDDFAQKTIQNIRTKHGTTTPYAENDIVQKNDNVVLNYKGYVDGKEIERLVAENDLITVGTTPLPGFDDNLLGMKSGDEKEFTVKMPDDLPDILAGKEINFWVKLILGSKTEPVPLDDALAVKIGFSDVKTMMSSAQSMADSRLKEMEKTNIINQITNRLVSSHDFKIPVWLSSAEAQFNAKVNGENWDTLADFQRERYVAGAERNIKLTLILNKVREEEVDTQLSMEETISIVKENLKRLSNEPEKQLETLYNNGQLAILCNRVKDDYTMEFIMKTCKIVE